MRHAGLALNSAACSTSFSKGEEMKSRIPEVLAVLSIAIAILLVFHQQWEHGFWFQWYDFWHHEGVEAVFVSLAAGLLLGKYLGRL
jgi:hypothetical protein